MCPKLCTTLSRNIITVCVNFSYKTFIIFTDIVVYDTSIRFFLMPEGNGLGSALASTRWNGVYMPAPLASLSLAA